MQTQSNGGLIRLGILSPRLAGVLLLVWYIGMANTPDANTDPTGAARYVSSTGYFVGQFTGGVLGIIALLFGFFALFAYLANTRGRHLAFVAMILGVAGASLQMTQTGVIVFAIPVIGKAYLTGLAGQHSAMGIANGFFEGPAAAMMLVSIFLLYSAGTILFGIAIWRSGTLPKWVGVLFAIHGPLMAGPVPEIFLLVGSAFLLLSGIWITWSILFQPSIGIEVEARPRVQ